MSIQDQLLDYKKRIKEWEKLFLAENGKLPSKSDVKANKDIRKSYKTYNYLKEKLKKQTDNGAGNDKYKALEALEVSSKSPQLPQEPQLLEISMDFTDDDLDGEDADSMAHTIANAEFGPTPQANGKVLSIFDMILSPPDSSPLKLKTPFIDHQSSPVKAGPGSAPQHMFRTPTKAARKIQFTDLTPSRASSGKSSIMAKLRQASSPRKADEPAPGEEFTTPTKAYVDNIMETPFYLGKVNNKFLFKDSNTSPVGNILTTPTKASPSGTFQVSPSPLKPERIISFGSTRSVSEIFNAIPQLDFEEFEAQKLEIEKELQQNNEKTSSIDKLTEHIPQTRKRKVLTQKRTTRRWKMKPNAPIDYEDAFEGKNIHDEIKKLDEDERKCFAEYMEGQKSNDEGLEEDEDGDEEELAPRSAHVNTNSKKLKPISNNFQRLKINDPRTKRFKQRMRRR